MTVRYYYPQASYAAAEKLQRLWGWWIVLGGLSAGVAGYLHFSKMTLSKELKKDLTSLGWDWPASVGDLVSWGLFVAAVMMVSGLLMSAAITWGFNRRRSMLIRASSFTGVFSASILTIPLAVTLYELLTGLMDRRDFDPTLTKVAFFTFLLMTSALGLLLLQGWWSGLAFVETFKKHPYPAVQFGRGRRIEAATAEDLPQLKAIFEANQERAKNFRTPKLETWEELDLQNHLLACRVYRRHHELMGFTVDSADDHRLRLIHVERGRQKEGVGRALLDDFVRRASERGTEGAVYTSFSSAYPSMGAFLRAYGWSPSSDFDGKGHTLYKKVL